MQIRIEVLSCSADKQICMYHKLKSDHQSSLHNVTVAVQWGVWWRGPSEQLYHQWDQHYDNHLTTIYLLCIIKLYTDRCCYHNCIDISGTAIFTYYEGGASMLRVSLVLSNEWFLDLFITGFQIPNTHLPVSIFRPLLIGLKPWIPNLAMLCSWVSEHIPPSRGFI